MRCCVTWWRDTVRSHRAGEGGLLGLPGGANIICIDFQYYLNTVSLPTYCWWFPSDLWFVSGHNKLLSSPSLTIAWYCRVPYCSDPCRCPSWGVAFSVSLCFQSILCGKKSKDEDSGQCSCGAGGHGGILAWWRSGEWCPHLAICKMLGSEFTSLVSETELMIQG